MDRRAEAGGVDPTEELVAESIATSAPRSGGLVRSGIMMSAAVLAANALNAVFQFVMARILDPGEFSLLATLFAVIVMITVPMSGLQAVVARDIASRLVDGGLAAAGSAFRQDFRQVGRWIAYAAVVTAIITVPLIVVLDIEHPLAYLATAIALAVALPLPIALGALQGAERFGALSIVQPVFAGLKLAAGIVLGLAGLGAAAIVFGVAGATMVTLAIVLVTLRDMLDASRGEERSGHTLVTRYTAATAIGVCGYAVHTNIDILAARIFFDPTEAGEWAAAAIAAKTVLLVPVGVVEVLFPRVAILRNRDRERGHMLAGLAVVAVLGAAVAGVFWIFSDQIIDVAFGSKYSEAADYLGPLAFAMVLYALVQIYLFHFLALGKTGYALFVAASLLVQFGLYVLLHSSPQDLVLVQLLTAGLLVVVGEIFQLREGKEPERDAAGEDPAM